MLEYLSILGMAIALTLFAFYIKVLMEIANTVGTFFRRFIKYLANTIKNKKKGFRTR